MFLVNYPLRCLISKKQTTKQVQYQRIRIFLISVNTGFTKSHLLQELGNLAC